LRDSQFRYFYILALIILISLPWTAVNGHIQSQRAETVVRISPAASTVDPGEVFTVEIWVDDVLDLYGADIQLAFNPAIFEVVDANPSLAGVQITVRYDFLQPAFILRQEADNQAGTIWFAGAQLNPAEPVSGSGVLFEFQLRAKTPGGTALIFTNHQLSAYGGDPIPHEVQEAWFRVAGEDIYLPLILR
jgi:hypothetical protein